MTQVAEQLHATQPALSKQMRFLEHELGSILLTRRSFFIALIEEGRLLRRCAEGLVAMADRITNEFLKLDNVLGGDFYLGLAESHQVRSLTCEIKRLKGGCPGMRYHIASGDTEQIAEKLDKGLFDFAALMEKLNTTRYKVPNLSEADRWGIVTRADDELARKTRASVNDLEGLPLFCSEQS